MCNMESESITTHKISDSGYSHSGSNSNSRQSASSKSRHSGSNSSRSSGYCGGNSQLDGNSVDTAPQAPKRNKEKLHKKKKPKLADARVIGNTTTINEGEEKSSFGEEVIGSNITPHNSNEVVLKPTEASDDKVDIAVPTLIAADQSATEKTFPWDNHQLMQPTTNQSSHKGDSTDETKQYSTTESTKTPPNPCEDGFCCVISLYDGVVLYTTASITKVLGFPKDMWIGRSFIDFVHPKDRETFSSQIANGIAIPMVDSSGKFQSVKHSVYVCLRKYRGLKSFGVANKPVSYQTFKLTVTVSHISDSLESKYVNGNGGMFLVVVAVPVYSSYKAPDESRDSSSKFCMRHTVSCVFSHVDPEVVANFGFLPQDMLGKSVFDFYHPDDMPFLKEIYQSVLRTCPIAGSVFRSKPYRFAVQNGGFAIIETEWSSYVDPWSRRLEFVIGLHKVLQGPCNPDIFEPPKTEGCKHVSEYVLSESKIIQEEILVLLNKELPKPIEIADQEVSKRCKDLAVFMGTLMEKVYKSTLQLELPPNRIPTLSVNERDSVMLGEISPHHDYQESKTSSETPPSYNQLNYYDNIQRFFKSKPKTTISDESTEQVESSLADQEGKSREGNSKEKCVSPVENSTSGSGSAGKFSSGSNFNADSGTSIANTSEPYMPHLTAAMLSRHNETMEKIMIKKHKENRHVSKERDTRKPHYKTAAHRNTPNDHASTQNHGLKRSGSHSWEGDSHKVSKHKHQAVGNNHLTENGNSNGKSRNVEVPYEVQMEANDVNLWPPFPMSETPLKNSQVYRNNMVPRNGETFTTGMFPVYYIPQATIPTEFADSNVTRQCQVQYVPSMIYNCNTLIPGSPMICSPLPMLPVPMTHLTAPMVSEQRPVTMTNYMGTKHKLVQPGVVSATQSYRPASQATSVKAEPGSGMGSNASVSIANKAMSESSRKDFGLQSVCSPDSPLVSPPDGETAYMDIYKLTTKTLDIVQKNEETQKQKPPDEESSCSSSFYSSFLKTDTGSGDDSIAAEMKNRSDSSVWQKPKYYRLRKEPPWMENVAMKPELVYRYQMAMKDLDDILAADLKTLKGIQQPLMVNSQLEQLYVEMELGGLSMQLPLDEGITSSSSEDNIVDSCKPKKKRRSYSSLIMIYEENAPLPPPDE